MKSRAIGRILAGTSAAACVLVFASCSIQPSSGISLDITAQDLGAAREIVARARHADDGPPDPAVRPHTGEHGGSGDIGHCPIVHRGTTVTVTEIGGGVRVVVLATDPTQVDALVTETRARLRWLDPANHP